MFLKSDSFSQDWHLALQAREVLDYHQAGRALATVMEDVKVILPEPVVWLSSWHGCGNRRLFPGLFSRFISSILSPSGQNQLRIGPSWRTITIRLLKPARSQH